MDRLRGLLRGRPAEVEEEEKEPRTIQIYIPPFDDPDTWHGTFEAAPTVPPQPQWTSFIEPGRFPDERFPGVGHRLGSLDEVIVPSHAPPPVAPMAEAAAAAAAAPDPAMASAAQNVSTHEKVIPLFVNNPPILPEDSKHPEYKDGEWHLEVPESWLKDERNWTPDFLDLFIQKDELLTPNMQRIFRSASPEDHGRILGVINAESLSREIQEKLRSTRYHNFLQVFDLPGIPVQIKNLSQMYSRLFFNVLSKNMKHTTRVTSLITLILSGIVDPITFLTPDVLASFQLKVYIGDLAIAFDYINLRNFLTNGKPWKNKQQWGKYGMRTTYIGAGPFFDDGIDLPREYYNSSMLGLYYCIHNIFLIDLDDASNKAVPCILRFVEHITANPKATKMKECLNRVTAGTKTLTYIRALAFYINWFFSYHNPQQTMPVTNAYLIRSWRDMKTIINDDDLVAELEHSFIPAISPNSKQKLPITLEDMCIFLEIMNLYQQLISRWLVGHDASELQKYLDNTTTHLPYVNPSYATFISLAQIEMPARSYNPFSIYYHPELWSSSKTPILPIDSHDFTPPITSWSATVTNRARPVPLRDDFPSVDAPNILTQTPFVYPTDPNVDFRSMFVGQDFGYHRKVYRNIPQYIYMVLQKHFLIQYKDPIFTFNKEGDVVKEQPQPRGESFPPRSHEGVEEDKIELYTDVNTRNKVGKLSDSLFSRWGDYSKESVLIRIPDIFIPAQEDDDEDTIMLEKKKIPTNLVAFDILQMPLLSAAPSLAVIGAWCRLLTEYASEKNIKRFRAASVYRKEYNPDEGWVVKYPPIYTCCSAVDNIFNVTNPDYFKLYGVYSLYNYTNRIIIDAAPSVIIDIPTSADDLRNRQLEAGGYHCVVIGFDRDSNTIMLYDSSAWVRGLLGLSNVIDMRDRTSWEHLGLHDFIFPDRGRMSADERKRYNARLEDLISKKPSDPDYPTTDEAKLRMIQKILRDEFAVFYRGRTHRDKTTATMRVFRMLLAHHVWSICGGLENPPFDHDDIGNLSFLDICKRAADGGHPFNFQFSYGDQWEQNKCGTYSCYAAMFLTMQPTYTFVPGLASPLYSPQVQDYNCVNETIEQFLFYMAMCLESGEIISSQRALREQVRKFLRLKLRRQFGLMDFLSTWLPPTLKRRRREEPDPPPPPAP